MKVLAIVGSPRKGNSYKITRMIEEKMGEMGKVEFEYLFLKDMELGACIGCHKCVIHGEDTCHLQNDRKLIESKMDEADGVIFVSPVYMFHLTGLMKNFIDRFTYLVHRPKFFNKKAMVFVLRGGAFKDVVKYMTKVAKGWGFDVTSKLDVVELDSLTPKYRKKSIHSIEKAACKFYRSLSENKMHKPTMNDLIWFNFWKLNAKVGKEGLPTDYRYWDDKGWFSGDYFYKTRVGIVKKLLMIPIMKMARVFMGRIFKGY